MQAIQAEFGFVEAVSIDGKNRCISIPKYRVCIAICPRIFSKVASFLVSKRDWSVDISACPPMATNVALQLGYSLWDCPEETLSPLPILRKEPSITQRKASVKIEYDEI